MPRESLGSLTTSFDNFLCYLKIKHLRYSYKKKQKMEHSTTCMIQNPFLYLVNSTANGNDYSNGP